MATERWARIADIFAAAAEEPNERRAAFIRAQCGGDDAMAGEVHALLDAHDSAAREFLTPQSLARFAALVGPGAESALPGATIGPYIVERELGRGGMAIVYLARDPRLEREVALKLLPVALSGDPRARDRLVAEARAVSRLDHPNIATVYDLGETDDGRVWVAMARYMGETLRRRIARGALPVNEALDIARQLAAGLAAAHAHGIVHRDVKPENVIVTADGVAKLLDFGIAKATGSALTRSGVLIGTVEYMSPEQTFGDVVDASVDVWALGIVLYEMLAGRRPFDGKNDATLIHAIRHEAPRPLAESCSDVPNALAAIVERCLKKEPAQRFASMSELQRALAAASEEPVPALAAPREPPRTRYAIMAVAAAALAVSALAIRGRVGDRLPIVPAAASMIVLPFAPGSADSSLGRLGKDLAITLARTIDGLDTIRVVDPLLIVAELRRGSVDNAEVGALARRLGIRSVIGGSIVRSGSQVRVDATLREVATGTQLADASVTGHSDSLNVLTDALAVELLREVWRRGAAPVPSLAAVTTRSMTALRAYLEGERAVVEGRFRDAPDDFRRAIAADSTFWFAYLRYWYARAWHGLGVDSSVRAAVAEHLDAFPEADRMLARARLTRDQVQRLQMLRQTTRAFPNHWHAWFEYADWLAHSGPYHGIPQSETQAAFENVVSLNADLAPAWEHLLWVAVAYRETQLADSAVAALRRIHVDSLRAREVRYDILEYYEHLAELTRSRGAPNPVLGDAAAPSIARARAVSTLGGLSTGLQIYGFHRAQIDLLDRVDRLRPPLGLIAAHQYGRALAWAGRGAWDSALVAADRFARDARRGEMELLPVHIATLGALVGAIDSATAATRLRRARNDAQQVIGAAATESTVSELRTELVWLEGIQAFNRRDAGALGKARDRLRAMPPQSSAVLQRSLAAFAGALAGRTHEAGDSLAALEREGARFARQSALGDAHPTLNAVNRLFAARWLAEAGDTTAAAALLTFYETIFPSTLSRLYTINAAIAPFAMAERARIAVARGEHETAARLFTLIVERMDSPVPALRLLVDEATRALAVIARDPATPSGRQVTPGSRK